MIHHHHVDEALAAATESSNELGSLIWTSDLDAARALALLLECGSVWINAHGVIRPDVPFGGVKQSGLGVQFGQAS
ncbi:aldehyde dehydrogenase family protein [Paracoccus sp. NSM]|uniref:aldehyde dehydrogenase family protein n=1 Tax=Paracoccus sp. NSM TaxID=3457784 RepID=UPI004036F120